VILADNDKTSACVRKFKYSPRSIGTPDIHSADIYPVDVHSFAVARRATGSRSCGKSHRTDGEQSLPLQGSDSAFPPSRPSGLWAEAYRTSVEHAVPLRGDRVAAHVSGRSLLSRPPTRLFRCTCSVCSTPTGAPMCFLSRTATGRQTSGSL